MRGRVAPVGAFAELESSRAPIHDGSPRTWTDIGAALETARSTSGAKRPSVRIRFGCAEWGRR